VPERHLSQTTFSIGSVRLPRSIPVFLVEHSQDCRISRNWAATIVELPLENPLSEWSEITINIQLGKLDQRTTCQSNYDRPTTLDELPRLTEERIYRLRTWMQHSTEVVALYVQDQPAQVQEFVVLIGDVYRKHNVKWLTSAQEGHFKFEIE